MKFRTNEVYVKNVNKVFDVNTNCWIDKPKIANIGHIINERIIKLQCTTPIKRGVKIGSQHTTKDIYVRNNMATIHCENYDDIIRNLKLPAYKLWQVVKKHIKEGNATVKLNITIAKIILNISDASNANKAIKNLVDSKLIIKAKGYKDLYSINPNLYFRGDYNKLAIDYINAGYNKNGDVMEEEAFSYDESDIVDEKEYESIFVNNIKAGKYE